MHFLDVIAGCIQGVLKRYRKVLINGIMAGAYSSFLLGEGSAQAQLAG